jgi:hypothetical protein
MQDKNKQERLVFMSRLIVLLFPILIGICYGENQNSTFTLSHRKGFSQCYKNLILWANENKNKYHFSDISTSPDSGIIRISSSSVTFHDNTSDSCRNNLILISKSDSLKFVFLSDSSSKSCLAERTAIQTLEKNEISNFVSNLSDSIETKEMIKQQAFSEAARNQSYSKENSQSESRTFFGVITTLAGVIGATVTIVDGNGSDKITKSNGTTETVQNRWSGRSGVVYTIDLTLSIGVMAAGIALLCK